MTPFEEYAARNGIDCKKRGGELVIVCPNCGSEGKSPKCYVNPKTWLWHCKHCDAKGNEYQMKKLHGHVYDVAGQGRSVEQERRERMEAALAVSIVRPEVEQWRMDLESAPEAQHAREYLQGRSIPVEVAVAAGLGWCCNPPGQGPQRGPDGHVAGRRRRRAAEAPAKATGPGWLTIPSFGRVHPQNGPDMTSVGVVKLRSVPPAERDYRRIKGGESLLFAPKGIDYRKTVIITGGEIDALSCVAVGWDNVCSGTTGEGSWSDMWTRQLEQCEDIVVIYDNDQTGREGAMNVARKLGLHRARVGAWPDGHKDANAALMAGALDAQVLDRIVHGSTDMAGEGVVTMSQLREKYMTWRLHQRQGRMTGLEDFDALMNGLRGGEVTVVTGDTGSGKSTWASDIALRLAEGDPGKGIKPARILFAPLELGVIRQTNKWVRQLSGRDPATLDATTVEATYDRMERLPLWLFQRYGGCSVEALRNTLIYASKRLDVDVVVLDHLHMAVDEGHKEERSAIDSMMRMLAEVALQTDMHIFVIAHPHGTGSSKDKDRDNRIIQLGDLKGSSGIKQLADNVVSLWRPRSATREGVVQGDGTGAAVMYLLKVRDDSGQEGEVPFVFDFASSRYFTDRGHGHDFTNPAPDPRMPPERDDQWPDMWSE